MHDTFKATIKSKDEVLAVMDDWGTASPETNSTIAGAGAVVAGIIALNATPALFVTGSVIYTLFKIGDNTQKTTLKRWSKPDEI